MTLSDLIAWIEAASEGSAELDLEIWRAKSGEDWRWLDREREIITCDRYGAGAASNPVVSLDEFSRSLGAALTLLPEEWRLETLSEWRSTTPATWYALVRRVIPLGHCVMDGADYGDARAPTPALALVSAALRARSMT